MKPRRSKTKQTPPTIGQNQVSQPDGETVIIEVLTRRLRASNQRAEMLKRTGWPADRLEEAMRSPVVQRALDTALAAFAVENLPLVVENLFHIMRRNQAWAWKLLLEISNLSGRTRGVLFSSEAEVTDAVFPSEFERELLEDLRSIVRGRTSNPPQNE